MLVSAVGALSGQQPSVFRSSVEGVQLSVVVTDADGRPVAGLTEDDFEIIENREPRPITTFSAVDIPIERRETTPGERDVIGNDGPPGRVYLIVLDQMRPEYALRTRAFLRDFIERYFGPNDTASVVLTTRGHRQSGHEFTTNTRLLLTAIDKFDGGDPMGGWEREKNFTQDLHDLLRVVASTQGARKAVIFVSESIPVDPYRLMGYQPGRFGDLFTDVNPDFQDAMSLATRNNVAFYPVDPSGLTASTSRGSSVRASYVYSNGRGTTVGANYAYGAGGGAPGISTANARFDLSGLAELTGGFALTGSNAFSGAFERLVREHSTYYVLGFNSGDDRRDGRFVGVEVRVKRSGLQVRSLNGYIAPRGKPEERRIPKTVLAATWDAVASPLTTSGVPMRVFAAPFRSEGKNATVAITLEIAADRLSLIEQDGLYRGEFELLFAITDATNKRHPIYRHRALAALKPETYERVSRTALRVMSQLPLPKGRYQLRASAGGAANAGSVVYDLVVPDFADDLAMSGVAITSAQAGETYTVSPHREMDVEFPGPPTTAREFSRDDTLTVFTEAYENRRKPHTVTFTVELRGPTGAALGTFTSERKSEAKPKAASVYAFSPHLDLSEVPPGQYALHVDVHSSLDTHKSLTRDIPIKVR